MIFCVSALDLVPLYSCVQILRLVMELPYSRKMEMEADYIGLVLMSRACFNPSYAPQFFLTVARMAPQENAFDALVSTHPSLADRSKRLREVYCYCFCVSPVLFLSHTEVSAPHRLFVQCHP